MIKMLQVEYVSKAPSKLSYQKHARIETSTTWGGFYCSINKKLINLPLNNRVMSCSHLDTKVLEVMEQGRMGSKLKMVTPNHIKHKPIGCNASPLIKKFEKHTNLKVADVDDDEEEEVKGSGTSGMPTPMPPFSSQFRRSGGDTATSRLVVTWMSLSPLSKWGLLGKNAPLVPGTDPDKGLFCTVNWNPVPGPALLPL